MALITAAQFREHYPALTSSADDAIVSTLIARADSLLAAWCGYPLADGLALRTLEAATYTIYGGLLDPRTPRRLALPVRPLVSVSSVHVDAAELHGTGSLLPADAYALEAAAGALWLYPDSAYSWWARGAPGTIGVAEALERQQASPRAVRVVCSAGYATTPPDLVALAAATVRHIWDRRRTAGLGTQTAGGTIQTYSDADAVLPQAVRQLLGPYVIWSARAG